MPASQNPKESNAYNFVKFKAYQNLACLILLEEYCSGLPGGHVEGLGRRYGTAAECMQKHF